MTPANTALSRVMSTRVEAQAARDLAKLRAAMGPSEVVDRFIGCYSKVRVQKIYTFHLMHYFSWLAEKKGVLVTPDELVADNLRSIYKSEPEDVVTKRKHRAWLEDYVNGQLAGLSESHRRLAAAAVKGFYKKNDSPLFGRVTVTEELATAPPRALKADDIRKVLKALPLNLRTPLLCMWQSGCEISRVLALRWGDLDGLKAGTGPLKLMFYGRKRHEKTYFTYLGKNAVEHLKLWGEGWKESVGRPLGPGDLVFLGKQRNEKQNGTDGEYLNYRFRETALRLANQGIVQNDARES